MSLIRARVVYGGEKARKIVEQERAHILSRPRDKVALKKEMLDMRGKIEKQFGSKDPWALKHVRGGLTDIMFVAHYLALISGRKDVFDPDVGLCLDRLFKAKILSAKDFRALSHAYGLCQSVMGFLRLCALPPFQPQGSPAGVKQGLVLRVKGKKADFKTFSKEVEKSCKESFAVFKKVMEQES
jgi:glutamate-ammonia-ligase adenylyltransferase